MKFKTFTLLVLISLMGCDDDMTSTSGIPPQGLPNLEPTIQEVQVPFCAKRLIDGSGLGGFEKSNFFQFARELYRKCSKARQKKELKSYLDYSAKKETNELYSDIALIFNLKGE